MGTVDVSFLKSSNRFTAYSFYPIELKLDRTIPDINPHNRSELDFSISFQGARLLKYLNRFTAYSIHPIELKFGRIILDIIPYNFAQPGFRLTFRGCCGARLLQFSNRFNTFCSSYAIELKLCRMIQDISPHKTSASDLRYFDIESVVGRSFRFR